MIVFRKHFLIPITIVGSLVLAPALVGCGMNPLESVIEEVTGGNVDIGGTSIPEDFPAEVPLIDGELISAFSIGTGAEKVFAVMLKVSDASAADAIGSQLEGAGFSLELDQAASGAASYAYTNANFAVLVAVTEDGNKGWAASYVVTPVVS